MTDHDARLPISGRVPPAQSPDTAFFWDGTSSGVLLIQRCTGCGTLRHPPGPTCPACHSFDWDTVESTGRGTVASYVVQHHPRIPAFEEPAVIVVVELDEGVRLVSNTAETPAIGDRVEVFFLPQHEGWTAPQFRPERPQT